MCIYIYTHMYVNIYIYVHVCICIYIYILLYEGETAARGGCRASKLGSDCSVASWRHKAEPPALETRPCKSKDA